MIQVEEYGHIAQPELVFELTYLYRCRQLGSSSQHAYPRIPPCLF